MPEFRIDRTPIKDQTGSASDHYWARAPQGLREDEPGNTRATR